MGFRSKIMKLLTHNSLKCPVKGVNNGYPLLLDIEDMEVIETQCNREFIRRILPTLCWEGVAHAAKAINLKDLPDTLDPSLLEDDSFLLAMHNLLLDVHVISGKLTCPETNREFRIENGIPNMMMNETEV